MEVLLSGFLDYGLEDSEAGRLMSSRTNLDDMRRLLQPLDVKISRRHRF
jgi:hypothetical protein